MKILKRNQLVLLVISLMLITAGYLNFTANSKNITTSMIADRSDTKIGDAELVSTVPKENEEENVKELINGTSEENKIENEEEKNESIATDVNTQDYYFTSSKIERNNMYSQSLETYQEIYNNSNATQESKKDAINNINRINKERNAVMIAENLIIAKGFEDIVIFVNEGSISAVVKAKELKQEEVAQIQNILSRELNASAEIIHISNK